MNLDSPSSKALWAPPRQLEDMRDSEEMEWAPHWEGAYIAKAGGCHVEGRFLHWVEGWVKGPWKSFPPLRYKGIHLLPSHLLHVFPTWMNLKNMMLSERSQA